MWLDIKVAWTLHKDMAADLGHALPQYTGFVQSKVKGHAANVQLYYTIHTILRLEWPCNIMLTTAWPQQ